MMKFIDEVKKFGVKIDEIGESALYGHKGKLYTVDSYSERIWGATPERWINIKKHIEEEQRQLKEAEVWLEQLYG